MQCPWSFLAEDQDLAVELPEQIKTERSSPARSPASERTEARSIAGESRCPHPEHEAPMTGLNATPISGRRSHRVPHVPSSTVFLYLLLWVRCSRRHCRHPQPRRLQARPHRRVWLATLSARRALLHWMLQAAIGSYSLSSHHEAHEAFHHAIQSTHMTRKQGLQEQVPLHEEVAATRVPGWEMYLAAVGR